MDDEGNILGVVGTTYSLETFFTSLPAQKEIGLDFGINLGGASLITAQNTRNSTYDLPTWVNDPENIERDWHVIPVQDRYILMASSPVITLGEERTLNWQLSAYLPLESALSTLYFSRNGLLIISGIIMLLASLASIFLARSISIPLVALTSAAEEVLDGNLNVKIDVAGQDEVGTLANTFTQMTNELSGLVNNLETTVESRTKDLQRRTLQMETSAQVARQAAEIRDLQTLLNESVNLVSERFGFYHAGIFLLDSAGRYAVLQAASSPGGQRMLARGHRLQVGKVGVVGYCAGTGLPRISQDVGADIVYYDNPDMPRTRSELALPLRVRNTIIGVLDVQSTEASAFSKEDIDVLQTLADQVALAIDNVRLLQSSQRALDELQRLYGQQAGQAWRQKLTGQPIAYQFTATGVEVGDRKVAASMQNRPGHRLQKEIKFRGQTIGSLNLLREASDGNWSEDEQALIDEILEQTALALENARLVDQIRLRSDQIQLLQEVSTISSEILDEEKLLPILAEKLQTSLDVEHCGVVLLYRETARLVANASTLEQTPEIGASIHIEEEPITQRLVRNKEVDMFMDVQDDTRTQAFIETFATPLANTLIFLPILVREQTVGYIYLEDTKPERDTDAEEINLFNQLSTQVSTALENIRLFDETTYRAERERQVAEITAKIRSSNDPQEILHIAVAELKKALNPQPVSPQQDISTSTPASTENGKDVIKHTEG
jgi:GAF domain-containing protein/HAMP domain-containing protein